MIFGLGSVVVRRILIILVLLMPLLILGVEGLLLLGHRSDAMTRAREDARQIQAEAKQSQAAAGPGSSAAIYYREAARVIADEAADTRARGDCDWQRDNRLVLVFDASGAPVRMPDPAARGAISYPGSSIPGVEQGALSPVNRGASRSPGVSLGVHADGASCLVDGTAIGAMVTFEGGSFTAMRLVAFDWASYVELLAYAYGALLVFWLLAELVAWQFNVAVNRRIGRITGVLQTVERHGFSDRVPVDGGHEFALLGKEINAMIVRLGLAHRYFADLNSFVAHNLRSPVTVARTLVEGLARTTDTDALSLLAELDRQLVELDRRCRDLLDQAKLEMVGSDRSDPVDMAIVVARQVEDIFDYLARDREMEIELVLAPAEVAMPSDTQELIIDNLLQNALKFGAQGTALRVELEAEGGEARLLVANRGASVPPSQFEAIFERGMTTGGHGLGLYAVRTAARLHGGDVAALPDDGGFRILVTLPLARE